MTKKYNFYKDDFILPRGFFANGIHAGIKKNNIPDLGVLLSLYPAASAGMFTSSHFKGHCIDICKERLSKTKKFYGVIVNSGNSNTATGQQGRKDSEKILELLYESINKNYKDYKENPSDTALSAENFLISHTGVIGFPLPMDNISKAVPSLTSSIPFSEQNSQKSFATAILTTDSKAKGGRIQGEIDGKKFTLSGVAKGAGMIAPNMATMLCYISTDLDIEKNLLQQALEKSVFQSFNAITVDGDMSPDDSVIIFANGSSGIKLEKDNMDLFQDSLNELTLYLAKQMLLDAEGANKLIEIRVYGAKNDSQARHAGLTIANSLLVKTAFFGNDANWGRILTALGYSKVDFNLEEVNLNFGPYTLCKNGQGQSFNEEELLAYLKNKEIKVELTIGNGPGQSTVYTTDLSYEYVRINADYRS